MIDSEKMVLDGEIVILHTRYLPPTKPESPAAERSIPAPVGPPRTWDAIIGMIAILHAYPTLKE